MTTPNTYRYIRPKKPWEGLCCMARCRNPALAPVALRYGGHEHEVGMCHDHARAHDAPGSG